MTGTHLSGLEGTNPLAFLAALGVQVLFEHEPEQPRLWWSDDVVPHAVIDSEYTVDRVADQAMEVFPRWLESPALNPDLKPKDNVKFKPEDIRKYNEDVKFRPEDIRKYLVTARQRDPGDTLAAALVAEGSLDNQGKAKPSDLHFTSANQRFLKMSREILDAVAVNRDEIVQGLNGPWKYQSKLPSLMWDVIDDRIYALSSSDPAATKKLTNPGPESLAIFGLSYHPVFAGTKRTLTLGCSGGWKTGGSYTWPLWARPAGQGAVRSLLAQATAAGPVSSRQTGWYRSWSLSKVLRSNIRRTDQGGFGNFAPPETVWSRE